MKMFDAFTSSWHIPHLCKNSRASFKCHKPKQLISSVFSLPLRVLCLVDRSHRDLRTASGGLGEGELRDLSQCRGVKWAQNPKLSTNGDTASLGYAALFGKVDELEGSGQMGKSLLLNMDGKMYA